MSGGSFLIAVLLLVCSHHSQAQSPKRQKIWLQNQVDHVFSSPDSADHFSITITGASIINGTLTFIIVNYKGQEIFREQHPSSALISTIGDDAPTNRRQEERYIKDRVKTFFDETAFSNPAIKPEVQFEKRIADYQPADLVENWKEIKSDSTAVGFWFLLYKMNGRNIAWSKKQKKVVVYESCC